MRDDTAPAVVSDAGWIPHEYTQWDPLGLGLARPAPHDEQRHCGLPELSSAVEPNLLPTRVPSDPRMRGWRVYSRKTAIDPERYRGVDTDAVGDVLVWEHPTTGELRRCSAVYLDWWDDPWREDNERIHAEIKRRVCTCKHFVDIDGDWGDPAPCECGRHDGRWTYGDSFWTENIKPVPKRRRAVPAQYPMHTRWGRFKDRLWRLTHRRPEPVPALDPLDDDEDWS
jgi:hypothetical protein